MIQVIFKDQQKESWLVSDYGVIRFSRGVEGRVITRVTKSNDSSIHYLTSGPPAFLFFWTVTHLLSPSIVIVEVTSRPSKVWTIKFTGVTISLFTGSEPRSGIAKRTKI